ncbi:hypothetical protein HRI_004802500 [Hibiscus trionum]|uniref:Zinc finger PHD-type domain-containing protein n=1 Tax=Hibiscus trionum TaxID=183268 RepID=A0A9W7MN71_HIBTR|nr:hypothetical protein HRI_004802500 [Hibiscus trionum]
MHLSIAQMGLKSDDFSNETDPVAVASLHSMNEDKPGDSLQHTQREASNLFCVNSNLDSYSENIETKATIRPSGVSDELEDVGIQRTFSNKYDGSKSVEGHDANISCASRASDANNEDLDIKNSSQSSLSVCSLGSEKVFSSQKPDFSELLSGKEKDAGSDSLRMQSPHSHSQSGKDAIGGSSEISAKIQKCEADIDNNKDVPLGNGDKSLNEGEKDESPEFVELPDKKEIPLEALSADEDYESDATEDVEVCDICGDAGQEDLLAICSKCSDGAEHTYCMREMLQKVPEGYWLCEECKLVEETETQKQGLDAEGEKANKVGSSMQSLAKRHAENLESALALKQKAVETSMGSPESLSPNRVSALSREGSFKDLNKGKVKPYLQNSFGSHSGNDMPETVRPPSGTQLQAPKGTSFKSNSFNSLNSKRKVKLVDEVVLQKQKSATEHASLDSREELGRMMDKSTNSGKLNTGESNFKRLSSKYLHVQDQKGSKIIRERIPLARKSSSKLDRSGSPVSIHKVDKKLRPCADIIFHSSASNHQETKAVQSDGKHSTLSKSISNLAHKDVVVPLTNGCISSDQKLNQLNWMEELSSSSSWTAEKQHNNFNGFLSDEPSLSLDSTNQSEKSREISVSRSSKSVLCLKCKEMSHAVDYCPVSKASGADQFDPRTSREDISKGNKLKAAIEAAIRLRPGIRDRASHVQSSISNKTKNMIPVEGIYEAQEDLHNQASIGNIKQVNSHSTDAISAVSSVANRSMRDISILPLASGSAVSNSSAIPEHEYIWLGAFEVHKSRKLPGFSAEIQAHLSTLASPKVLEVVNSFPHKVSLNEVPRLNTWPPHFHHSGPKEDNIALYFFAKDLESYENYKVLLDNLVKNDFALKGAFEGVELLIFPSNQLPENCQRWNALLFLWGVFKGRRVNSSNSIKSVRNPDASMVHLEREISIDITRPVDNKSAACDSTCHVVPVTSAVEKACISTERVGDNEVSSSEQAYVGIEEKLEEQDGKVDTKLLPRIATSSTQVHPETKCNNPPPEDGKVPDCRSDAELKPSLLATETISGSVRVEKEEMHVQEDYPLLKNCPTEKQMAVVVGEIDGNSVKIRDSMDDMCANTKTSSKRDIDCLQPNNRKRTYLDLTETVLEICTDTSQKLPWNEVKRVSIGEGSDNKMLKTGFSGINQFNSVRDQGASSYSLASERHDLCSASSVEEKKCDIASENKVIPKDIGSGEGFVFPVVSVKDEDRVHNASSNLELALGAETRPQNEEISPLVVGAVDRSGNHDKVTGKEKEDASASLSLSLSFPFPEKE